MKLFDRHRNYSINPVTTETQRRRAAPVRTREQRGTVIALYGCSEALKVEGNETVEKKHPQLWGTISWGKEFGCCHAGDLQ